MEGRRRRFIAELNRPDEVNEDNNNLVEETVVKEGLHIPHVIVQLRARQKTSAPIPSVACTVIDSNRGASALARGNTFTPTQFIAGTGCLKKKCD